MSPSEHTHTHTHDAAHDCSCSHDHGHDHAKSPSLFRRWLLSVVIVGVLLAVLRPFIIGQMLVRVTSYSANGSYSDVVRICQKIIFIDKDNRQAWTALGYAYMDLSQTEMAMGAFDKVLSLYPDDKGAASFELGQAYYNKGDWKQAIDYFERVRGNGVQAGRLLEADILKYRHGTLGFRNLNTMGSLLGMLFDCYTKTGDSVKAAEVQKEYERYKNKHSKILF